MQDFYENHCRLCPKTFCCKDCRWYHEEQCHNVNPECEICIYGRASVKNASAQLLAHIKSAHWPVHCVFCKKTFTTLDELLPHEKCPLKQDHFKMQTTPKTPVTSNGDHGQSIEVTPFYKALEVAQEVGCKVAAIVITSTPLLPKEEVEINEKITPIYQNLSHPHKSNLKLTESSNLSDSKKSERKVTFSETPSVSEYYKKPKCLPVPKHMLCEESENSTDDSSASLEEFKTAPSVDTHFEEKENFNNETINVDKTNSTLWESALTKFDGSSVSEITKPNHFNISVQINVLNNQTDSIDNKSMSLWSSMTNMVKSVVSNISTTAQNSFSSVSVKRSQSEDSYVPAVKRIKLTDLRCRRPLRDTSQLSTIRLIKPRFADKATQTEDTWM